MSLEIHLAAAAHAARQALLDSQPEYSSFLAVLEQYDVAVQGTTLSDVQTASPRAREAINTFQTRQDALRNILDGLVQRTASTLRAALADIERDSNFVTLMLFGRTRAGKSTTMEALTGGDGSTIGVGRQHTTTEIRAYYFPQAPDGAIPIGPALRIVDTPGIEGFDGDKLAFMAEEFVERSDHILFLLTDDKSSADELNRFGAIKTQGKGVTVLLNVKAADADLDLLISHPDKIFKADELDGHARRISGYLAREFGMSPPCIIPIHARAAWLGRQQEELPDHINDRGALIQNSRLAAVEQRIVKFICEEALPARLCAPRNLLLSYLYSLKDELRPFATDFRNMEKEFNSLARKMEEGAERARRRAAKRFPLLRARFQAVSDAIPGMLDTVISGIGTGAALNKQWSLLLQTHGVADAANWFVSTGQRDFEEELSEQIRTAAYDYEFSSTAGLGDMLHDYHEAEQSASRQKYLRAGIRTVSGVGLAALTGWAVANWWNPTGWVAGTVVALASAGSGILGEEVARKLTDELEHSSRKNMRDKRDNIITCLQKQIWQDFHAIKKGCNEWLGKTKAAHVELAHNIARAVEILARKRWQSTIECMRHLEDVADRVNAALVKDVFHALIPECGSGAVGVRAVVRELGFRTKVLVCWNQQRAQSALAPCIGKQGQRIRQIRSALGNEAVDLVDAMASKEIQVAQALGWVRGQMPVVTFQGGDTSAYVQFANAQHMRAIMGVRPTVNLRLAKKLFGFTILIEGMPA